MFRFREINEVKGYEKNLAKQKEQEQGFMKIKPETEMTMEEVEQFWKEVFEKAIKEGPQ